ncbi:uncharacterized protein LOC108150780 isoform X2 [Drosophila miranda]|uniref:uncharacterized protein LOC108150780 isoform X2 n=1 Tax=Drosophila miranda TaxID=7229 RepID=UPI0007E6F216|nr:uncharacterized protein LOC108150780 isoform X2 [Drosophila miranda]
MLNCSVRIVNLVLQFLTAVSEVLALVYLVMLLYTHCVLAGEFRSSVLMYVYFLPGITAESVIFVLCRVCCFSVGLDPIAIVFNLASGVLCTFTSLIMLLSMLDHCGNEYQYKFFIAGGFGLLAGILHLLNGVICNIYLPAEEWIYAKPSKRVRKRLHAAWLREKSP